MSDTARMLDDTAERLLSRHFATAVRGSAAAASALHRELIEAGLDLVLAPEEAGGLGGGILEAAVVAHRWGYHAASGPIVDILLMRQLAGAGLSVPDGSALGLVEGYALDGEKWAAPRRALPVAAAIIGGGVRTLVACVRNHEGGLVLVHFEAASAAIRTTMAGEAVAVLDLGTVAATAEQTTGLLFEDLMARGALLTASATLGAAQRLLEITTEHANTRKQFGKQLAQFQAIQHMVAEAVSELVVAQASTRSAIVALDAGHVTQLQWRAAKLQSARAATEVAAVAHQILGAIGFTEEHVLHHYSKRLWAWRDQWGREAQLRREVGDAACANADRLWSWMVD